MKKNILIACDNAWRELGETLCDKFFERKGKEIDKMFYITGDGSDIQQTTESIVREEEIDIFLNLTDFLDLFRIKKTKPSQHLFTCGFTEIERTTTQEAFETGFGRLKKSRYNLFLVRIERDGKSAYFLIYPEKTYEIFPSLEKAAEGLATNVLKRENVGHVQSIQESENAETPKEAYLQFQKLGKILFEKKFLPVVEGGTYGNFSLIHNGKMYITGRGVDKGNLAREDICRIDQIAKTQDLAFEDLGIYARIFYSGKVKPSIDTAINNAVMRETGCEATIHVHTDRVFAGYPQTGYNYPCGAKEELDEIIETIRNNPGTDIVQQYKHGLIAFGKNFDECLAKIETLFAKIISIRKITKNEIKEKEFREWEEHYKKNTKGKNVDIDIYDLDSLYVVLKGEVKVGLLYTKAGEGHCPVHKTKCQSISTLYFVFYSLEEFIGKKLGLGEKVIDIVSKIAKCEQREKIGILTTRGCNVIPYYEKKGFRITSEEKGGAVWMEKEVM